MPKWNLSDQNIYNLLNSSYTKENFDEVQLLMAYREFVESVIVFITIEQPKLIRNIRV